MDSLQSGDISVSYVKGFSRAEVDNKKLHTLFPAVYDRYSKVTQVGDFLKVKKYE